MSAWTIELGEGPLVAAAVHHGHTVRADVAERLALEPAARRREEDPHTGDWTSVAPTRIIGRRSRFEFDLNRPREKAVYLDPEDAWGLEIWDAPPPRDVVESSLAFYDAFYAQIRELLDELVRRHGRVVVLDLHSYNHRRAGPASAPADPEGNPEINVGTGSMDRDFWAPVVDRFIDDLRRFDFLGRSLDVRENVRFHGGWFPRWIHETFPGRVCAPAIEVKKFFMDEWTGEVDPMRWDAVRRALGSAVEGLLDELSG